MSPGKLSVKPRVNLEADAFAAGRRTLGSMVPDASSEAIGMLEDRGYPDLTVDVVDLRLQSPGRRETAEA
jgi:hypothetical protein